MTNKSDALKKETKPVVKGPASYFPSIEQKYGRPIKEWQALIAANTGKKHLELVEWLKSKHQLGHGHANALVAHTLAAKNKLTTATKTSGAKK